MAAIAPLCAQASVVIAATRIVYDAADQEVTLKLSNSGELPSLAQVWIDDGNHKADPAELQVPFTLSPPVFRIDPNKAQTLRIAYTREPLPADRETVFWLNVLDIPPKPAATTAQNNLLQLAFRTRIKLFFRPAGLQGRAAEAPGRIVWQLTRQGGRTALQATNPTPYHVTLVAAAVRAGEQSARIDQGTMLKPGETIALALDGELTERSAAKVHYSVLDDYGAKREGDAAVQSAASG